MIFPVTGSDLFADDDGKVRGRQRLHGQASLDRVVVGDGEAAKAALQSHPYNHAEAGNQPSSENVHADPVVWSSPLWVLLRHSPSGEQPAHEEQNCDTHRQRKTQHL